MRPTPSTAVLAERAVIYANAARSGHRASRHKTRLANLLVAKALMIENRKNGYSYSREFESILRRQ